MILTYFAASRPPSMTVPRRCRLRLPVLWLSRCFLPAWRRFSLPVPVTRKRFFEPLWVFILGMARSLPRLRAAARPEKKKRAPGRARGPGSAPGAHVPAKVGILYEQPAGAGRAKT